MIGSATTQLATGYVDRLRRTLARTLPVKCSDDDLARGLALDAEGRPWLLTTGGSQAVGDIWTRDSFLVQQYEDMGQISEKEPTWSGYGQDAGYIGQRFDFVIWDDLVDPKKQRTIEAKEALQDYWDDVSEPRLEPAGLLVLQGQRFASDDLYRYCLDKSIGEEMDDDTGEMLDTRPMYHHVKFKAHYEEKCNPAVTHKRTASAFPEGCLLSPQRLPWRELSAKIRNRSDRFEVVYQQQDTDPSTVLVPATWINGGDGYPGCLDVDRDRLELPKGLTPPLVSVMTVDPSPTRYWAIEWWIYQPETEFRYLMDLERTTMEAGDFLDYNPATRQYTGLLNEWVDTSNQLGWPISHVVVEDNAAAEILKLQYQMGPPVDGLGSVVRDPPALDAFGIKSDPEYRSRDHRPALSIWPGPPPEQAQLGGLRGERVPDPRGHPLPPRPDRRLRHGALFCSWNGTSPRSTPPGDRESQAAQWRPSWVGWR